MNAIIRSLTLAVVVGLAAMTVWSIATADEPIVVGVLHRADFAYADMMKLAMEMANEHINAGGGINGRSLQLTYGDDRGEKEAGEAAVTALVEEHGAVMLVGGYSSSNTLRMAYAADRLDTPFLVSTAADDCITQHNLANIYRLNPPASEYTKGLEEFLLDRVGPKSMSIVYENSPYGTGSARRMMAFCRENAIEIKGVHPYFKKGATSDYLTKILTPVREEAPDVLFMVAYLKDATLLVRKADEMKLNALLCGGAGGFTHEKFSLKAGQAAEHLVTATLWSPSSKFPQAGEFRNQFAKRFDMEPDYHAAEAYSALIVAADALKRATSLSSGDIRIALGETNLETPFGQVKFTEYGTFKRQNRSATQVFQIKNGRFETIWPPVLATSTYAAPLN
jgi:branched-chain amino acid transport system substrate-binding protein